MLTAGLLGSLVALSVVAAPAVGEQPPQQPIYHPRAGHIGVVVTAGEVLMSWHRLEGADAGTVVVRRGEGTCPRTPADGSPAGEVAPLHVIDRTVNAGAAYCYTLFSKPASGAVHAIGSSGLVTVPDVGTVPPATVPAPAPAPTVTVSAITRSREWTVGALAILLVAVVSVGTARRVAGGRATMEVTAPGSTRMHRRPTRDHTRGDRGAAGALEPQTLPSPPNAAEPRPSPGRESPEAARSELMDALNDIRPRRGPAPRVEPTAMSTKPDRTILAYASAYAAACQRGDSDPMAAVVGMVPPTTPDPGGYASQVVAEARRRDLLTGRQPDAEPKLSARALQLLHSSRRGGGG